MKNGFAEMLVYLRKTRGMSQETLAAKLNITRSALSNYEQGTRRPSAEVEEMIADFFNVSLSTLRGLGVDVRDDNEAQLLKFYRMLSDSKKDDAMTFIEWLIEKESENGNKI